MKTFVISIFLLSSLNLMCEDNYTKKNYFGFLASYSVVKLNTINSDLPFNQTNFDFKYYRNLNKNFKYGMGFNYIIQNGSYSNFDQLGIAPLLRYTYRNYVYTEVGYQIINTLSSSRVKNHAEQMPHIAIGCIVPIYRQINLEFQIKNSQYKNGFFKVNSPLGLLGLSLQF